MSIRVEVEDIETTRSEKLLAGVLAVFVLVAGIWTYSRIDDFARVRIPVTYVPSGSDQIAIVRLDAAQERSAEATVERQRALENLELRRETYRTALEAGRPAEALASRYDLAQHRYEQASRHEAAARRSVDAAEANAEGAHARTNESAERQERLQAFLSVSLRGTFIFVVLTVGYLLLGRLRRRGSRYFPLTVSLVAAAAVLTLIMAADYVTDYVDPADLGPILLSITGGALTIGAFVLLQRYLRRRLPYRRVRHARCPFCGYPTRGNRFCEGCGRAVVAECTTCEADRRVGALRCGACGAS